MDRRQPRALAPAVADVPSGQPPGDWSPTLARAAVGVDVLRLSQTYAGGGAMPALAGDGAARPPGPLELRELADERDRQLGLTRDGPLVTAARSVASGSSGVADESSVVLAAMTDADGNVLSVVASHATASPDAWDEVAAGVLRAMKGKRVRIPPGARGLSLAFKVESRLRTVDGHVTAASHHRAPLLVTADHPDQQRPTSLAFGTPDPECQTLSGEACTASANIDPTDALLGLVTRAGRTIVVESLEQRRLP